MVKAMPKDKVGRIETHEKITQTILDISNNETGNPFELISRECKFIGEKAEFNSTITGVGITNDGVVEFRVGVKIYQGLEIDKITCSFKRDSSEPIWVLHTHLPWVKWDYQEHVGKFRLNIY